MRYRFEAEVQRWGARRDDWFLVELPGEASREIRERVEGRPRAGFGAVKVVARVGRTSWSTSVFPGASGIYSLALNARVRRAEGVEWGERIAVEVELV